MAFLTEKKFDFVSEANEQFAVVSFTGTEGLSRCYQFEILLVSDKAEIDLDDMLQHAATFTIVREEGDVPFHGILREFEQLHHVGEYVFYRAVLVPKLWWLGLTRHNQVFLNQSVTEILQQVLKDADWTTNDFQLNKQNSYPKREYVCQYRESNLDFISRWMEREGIYFYFEQTDKGEKVIFTDTKVAHTEMLQGKTAIYGPPSAMDEAEREEVIQAFVCRQKMLPKDLRLKDYNYRTPSLDVSGSAEIKRNGRGNVYLYGDHFRTPEEGNALAKIRAEELLCQEKRFYGESTIPYLRPGYLFTLQDHYREGFNQSYLTCEIRHEGSQAAYLLSGIQKGLTEKEGRPFYRNSFAALPADVQFRPERKTEQPRFYGMMNATIDGAGSGTYAELDEQGRYKVVLPFDLSGRKDGKASAWLRMVQPYAGINYGVHFPLHKGTEVLLTFIDGNPDRPVISGAVPNVDTPSPITSETRTPQCDILTSGGNQINFQDEKDHERVVMRSPRKDSLVKVGEPLEDKNWYQKMGFDGVDTIGALIDYKATAIKAAFNLVGLVALGQDLGVDTGVELRSANGLKIGALKKEEAIGGMTMPGYAASSVTGLDQHSVKGYSEKSITGCFDESIKGWHSALIVGKEDVKVMGWGEYMALQKDSIVGKAQKVYGSVTKVAGWVKKGCESVVSLFGSEQKVVAEEIEMEEFATEAFEVRESAGGEELIARQERNGYAEVDNTLAVEEGHFSQSFMQMTEDSFTQKGVEIEMGEFRSSTHASTFETSEDSIELHEFKSL